MEEIGSESERVETETKTEIKIVTETEIETVRGKLLPLLHAFSQVQSFISTPVCDAPKSEHEMQGNRSRGFSGPEISTPGR